MQLYVRDVLASMARPVMELKGFRRLRLEPGAFRIMVGASSKDIRLRGELTVEVTGASRAGEEESL